MRELQVQALPDKIPSMVEVDISQLDIGDAILVKDITLPEGISIVDDPEKVVVTMLAPRVEKVEAEEGEVEAAAEVSTEPEVISQKETEERRKEKETREKSEKE